MPSEDKENTEEIEKDDEEEDSEESSLKSKYYVANLLVKDFSENDFISLQNYTVGQLLRQDQAGLCEIIYRSPKIWGKTIYCLVLAALFSAIYGGILASKSGFTDAMIMAAKVPCLLFATILICGPLLFALNMFLGIRLNPIRTILVLLVANYLISCFLISSAAILLLFLIATSDTTFLNILNIIFFGIAIGFGVAFIWRATNYFIQRSQSPNNTIAIKIWTVIYVLISLQLAWGIKVFGDLSNLPIFKQMKLEGNFYMVIFQLIQKWMGN